MHIHIFKAVILFIFLGPNASSWKGYIDVQKIYIIKNTKRWSLSFFFLPIHPEVLRIQTRLHICSIPGRPELVNAHPIFPKTESFYCPAVVTCSITVVTFLMEPSPDRGGIQLTADGLLLQMGKCCPHTRTLLTSQTAKNCYRGAYFVW